MAHMFVYKGNIYSVSDKNRHGEFVVLKMDMNMKDMKDAKIIPAKSEQHVEKLIRSYKFEGFKTLPMDIINKGLQ